jgi:hypothetical protein
MGYCLFCEKEPTENYFGSFCVNCRKIKNLGNCYEFPRILEILTKCCLRTPEQLENKIDNHKKTKSNDQTDYDPKPNTRSQKKVVEKIN